MEKYYSVAVHEKFTKLDVKKMLETGNLFAFNTMMQTLPKQREWIFKSELDLQNGDIVEVPFGTSEITHYGCVKGLADLNNLDVRDKINKIYNKVDKLSLRPIM